MSEETSKVSRGGQGATVDLDELERLALDAGGEEWAFDVAIPESGFCAQVWDSDGQDILTSSATDRGSAVVAHVAAANPAVVLELIRRVRAETNEIEALRAALSEIRDRLVDHPLYSPLTEDEEEDIGGDAAEFSYLVRVADAALEPQKVGDAEMQAGG